MPEGMKFHSPREMCVRAAYLAAPVFVAADQKWSDSSGGEHVPTADEIAERLIGLVENIVETIPEWPEGSSSSTGGLTVWRSVVGDDVRWGVEVMLGDFWESDNPASTHPRD